MTLRVLAGVVRRRTAATRVRIAALSVLCLGALTFASVARARDVNEGEAAAAFRERARAQMEDTLGTEVVTRQDAINAAYLFVGWSWGDATPDELDNAAFRRAWLWGFRIEEFARSRHEPFRTADLAEAPIRSSYEPPAPHDAAQSRAPYASVHPAAPASTPMARGAELAEMERRIELARAELARINDEIAALEAGSRTPASTRQAERLRAEMAALERSLEESQSSLGSMDEELRALSAAK